MQPAAIVVLEQVPHDSPARLLVGIEPDELDATIGGANGVLGQHPPDLIGLIKPGAVHSVEHLLLACLIGGHREGHQLFERHSVVGLDLVQLRRDRCEAQPLLHDRRRHEMPCGNVLFAHAAVAQ